MVVKTARATRLALVAVFLLKLPLITRGTTPSPLPTPQPTPEQCSSGQFYSLSESACTDCPAGQYHDITGPLTECTKCAAGQYSAESGYAECTTCNRGKYSVAVATVCTDCSVGTYADSSGELIDSVIATPHPPKPQFSRLLLRYILFQFF